MEFELVLYGGVALVGIVSCVVYYFARFYFRLGDEPKQLDSKKELEKKSKEEKPLEIQETKKDLRDVLAPTRSGFLDRIKSVFSSNETLGSDELEELEEVLYTSDLGPQTVQRLVEAVNTKLEQAEKANFDTVREALKNEIIGIFEKFKSENDGDDEPLIFKTLSEKPKPQVWMVVGVNGAGKTTTIGKLAFKAAQKNLKTMVVAGDTFRAAAGEQLNVWKERAGVEIFSPENVNDPSAVAFDGVKAAQAKGFDVVIIDTAGRLHTQDNLMEELKKMKRVVQKVYPEAPHETLIVLDANSGQNALVQTKKFNEALDLTGVVLTKLDGTAKGGVAVGLANEFSLPIKVIGVGEGISDLRSFKPQEFVDSIL